MNEGLPPTPPSPSRGEGEKLLEARDLKKSYRVDHQSLDVVKGVDLSIGVGEMTAIVGPSGAGKSTLLHLLGGLDRPSAGQVLLAGQDVQKLSDEGRARLRNEKIGFVFQFYHLIAELDCLENVMLPAMMRDQGREHAAAAREEAMTLLTELGLGPRWKHRPNQLSGGEQQRCAIARALINKPKLLLADEPTGNLDRQTSRAMVELLLALKATKNLTMVMVTHDEELAAICPRRLSMVDGKIGT